MSQVENNMDSRLPEQLAGETGTVAAAGGGIASGAGRLAPDDWKSGDSCWLVEVIAPFGKTDEMLADLRNTSLADKTFKFHYNAPNGKREVKTVKGAKA
jgi:hypothetical protein